MVDSFKKTGSFFETSGVPPLEPFTLPRRWYSLINTTGWALVTLPSVSYVLISFLFSGSLIYFIIGVLMVLASEYIINLSLSISLLLFDNYILLTFHFLPQSPACFIC